MPVPDLVFDPLVAPWLLASLGSVAAAVTALAALRRARGTAWRALTLTGLWVALLNPTLTSEEREPLDDVAAVVVDRSPSQRIGERPGRTDAAAAEIAGRLDDLAGIESRVVVVDDASARSTHLFGALAQALSDVPPDRVAGVVAITDGQVHDVPEALDGIGPLHVLLSGDRDERDRRLIVEQAPTYGVVGDSVSLVVRVEDDAAPNGQARIEARVDGQPARTVIADIGRPTTLVLPIEHAGATALELEVAPGTEELTLDNNRTVVVVNGVRDRLRVMLVSGAPNQGLRTWRNLLKADPSVDLVHFTILRPPNKQDMTPVRELSLIPFPTNELFDARLSEFDLIVFDSYHRRGILPMVYLSNVVEYVVGGGAVLDAAGPAFASPLSIAGTPLGTILPGRPTGRIFREAFRPQLTADGRRHPVTARLPGSGVHADAGEPVPEWGPWFRHIDVDLGSGTTLMDGYEDRPLLVLDRIGNGRVAQLLSDHSWLWARGFDGGGPQSDLLRRLVHWLMKEPDLEEEILIADVLDDRIAVTRRSLGPIDGVLTAVGPDGRVTSRPLVDENRGRASVDFVGVGPGLYRFEHDDHVAVAVIGTAHGEEFDDMRATDRHLTALAEATGGSVRWLASERFPDVRRVRGDRELAGRGWIGLIDRRQFTVSGLERMPVLPAWALLLIALGGLLLAWRAEGR